MKHADYALLRKLKREVLQEQSKNNSFEVVNFLGYDYREKKYFCTVNNKLITSKSEKGLMKKIESSQEQNRIIAHKSKELESDVIFDTSMNLLRDFEYTDTIEFFKDNLNRSPKTFIDQKKLADFEAWKKAELYNAEHEEENQIIDEEIIAGYDSIQARSPQWQQDALNRCYSSKYRNLILKDGLLNAWNDVKAKQELEFKKRKKNAING